MYFYDNTLCLEFLYDRRVMATPLGTKVVALLNTVFEPIYLF